MIIKLNEDYNIVAINGSTNFIQGNNNYDKIQVVIPKSKVISDDCLPSFSFTLPNNRVVGDFVHEETIENLNNYTFVFTIPEYILKHIGSLLVTITINFYNDKNVIIKKKKSSFQASVLKGTLVSDDIYIVGHSDDALISAKENYESINKRVDDFDKRIIGYDTKFDNLERGVANNSSRLNEVNTSIGIIQDRLDANDLELDSINGDISSIDVSIEMIHQDLDSIDEAVAEINNELDTLQTKMEPITALEIEAL